MLNEIKGNLLMQFWLLLVKLDVIIYYIKIYQISREMFRIITNI